ncbi:MAG TPA: Sec-independent protein translocase protein TatB [Croceibacterium sp.]|nr:Sec-independent protein translocase protein TatB [Croceibacterium sp.]
MFDIGPTELLVIIVVAVIAIGPKELPAALRAAGRWIGQMRRMSAHFRNGFDAMIREAEMQELEAKWAAQNAKIMAEHPADAPPEAEPTGAYPARPIVPDTSAPAEAQVVTSDNPDEYRDMPVSGDKPEG